MRITFRGHLAIAASLALLSACDSAPTQPATPAVTLTANATVDPGLIRGVDEYVNDLTDRTVTLGCEDGTESELVRLRGSIAEKVTHIQLPNGTVLYRRESRPVDLSGVGLSTGQEYEVINRLNSHDSYADRGVLGTSREVWELRNRTTGALFHLTYAVFYSMDADRNLISHREQERSACRP
jgi:hypothetical protein